MIPVFQDKRRHNPARGQWGNCVQAAFASLLELPIEDVPHFAHGGAAGQMWPAVDRWLAGRNLTTVWRPITASSPGSVRFIVDRDNPGLVYFLLGQSKTGNGHIVICKGREIWHDPNRRKSGIVSDLNGCVYGRYFVIVLVPLLLCGKNIDQGIFA